jgi:hypothetical protein
MEWSASCHCCFTVADRAPSNHWMEAGWTAEPVGQFGDMKNVCPCRKLNPRWSCPLSSQYRGQNYCTVISLENVFTEKNTNVWISSLKSIIFRDITPCSPLKFNRCFGGTYRLHLQCRRICRTRYQRDSRWQAELGLFFDPEDGGDVPTKRQLTFNGLHSSISQKILLFITTAVRTSNST